MMSFALKRAIISVATVTLVSVAVVPAAWAAGSSMPWEQPLQQILLSVEGPVAKIIAVIIIIIIPVVLLLWRRGPRVMEMSVPGFVVPVHRALTEPILLGGAPRSIAILNGTLAAAFGLGLRLWLAGFLLWVIGHALAVWAAKRDPLFVDVVRRHLRIPGSLRV
jgi:type IV secretion system protein VirB3